MADQTEVIAPPKAFISYSWDDEIHKSWVREFTSRLRQDGVDATIDQWAVVPGDRLPYFMEKAVSENSFVLIVCTPKYKQKSDNRQGGVGYEGDIMTAEVYAKGNHRKFITILRSGNWETAIPTWLGGKYGIDLSGDPFSETNYRDLLTTLHDLRDQAPPMGAVPRLSPTEDIINGSPLEGVIGFERISGPSETETIEAARLIVREATHNGNKVRIRRVHTPDGEKAWLIMHAGAELLVQERRGTVENQTFEFFDFRLHASESRRKRL